MCIESKSLKAEEYSSPMVIKYFRRSLTLFISEGSSISSSDFPIISLTLAK